MSNAPYVLMIEDSSTGPQEEIRRRLGEHAAVDLVAPSDVTLDLLRSADVVLLDHVLEEWLDREAGLPLALQPRTGLAVAGILRSHLHSSDVKAICLLTEHPELVLGGHASERRGHVLAQGSGLEWVFDKIRAAEIPAQVLSLAAAVRRIQNISPEANPREAVEDALDLSQDTEWRDSAWEHIIRCQPPLVEIGDWVLPLSILRWLLHRILPYPSFIYDDAHLATRLQVSLESLNKTLEGNSEIRARLDRCQYGGSLDSFMGRRWWRTAIDRTLREIEVTAAERSEHVCNAIRTLSDDVLEPCGLPNPVPVVGANLEPSGLAAIETTVMLQPDDWPAYAYPPRALIDLVKQSARLRLLVAPNDRDAIADDGSGAGE